MLGRDPPNLSLFRDIRADRFPGDLTYSLKDFLTPLVISYMHMNRSDELPGASLTKGPGQSSQLCGPPRRAPLSDLPLLASKHTPAQIPVCRETL
ncbi:hypothetical protein J6590_051551 [Homalodisca vitripennis]|nr:hypothetical protein J6590_051551 [Homalodisca vitripennis]